MRNIYFVIVISVISVLYLLLNAYVYHRASATLPNKGVRSAFTLVFWFCALSFLVGQFLERTHWVNFTTVISGIGSVWLALFFYALLLVIFIDLITLLHRFTSILPSSFLQIATPIRLFILVAGITISLVTAGYLNARYPIINEYHIHINKQVEGKKQLTIALATDIHMGYIIGNKRLSDLVASLNAIEADVIIFGGDLIDHNMVPVKYHNMGEILSQLHAPLGVWAVTGNHEYIGNAESAVDYLSRYGIQFVRDTVVNVQGIQLVGRDDAQKINFTQVNRKSLETIFEQVDSKLPIIVIDHQPLEQDRVVALGADLMVSGHTHQGQLWPFKILTKLIYKIEDGLVQKGNTHLYVSPGYGTWGPPVRIGNRPEIAVFRLVFE